MSNPTADPPTQSTAARGLAFPPRATARRDPMGMLWQLLQRPWLLITLGVCALLLILCALILPQLPAEIADNSPAVSRWLTEQSVNLPIGGNIVRAFGLFDVLHSPLLRLLLTLIGLTLLIHFADLIAVALHLFRLPKQSSKAADPDSPVITLRSPVSVYRRGDATADPAEERLETLYSYLSDRFDNVTTIDFDTDSSDNRNDNVDEHVEDEAQSETRILAHRNQNFALLRPLLMLGLILSLIPVWNIIVNGWELSPPPLAPGEFQRYESNQLSMRYELSADDDAADGAVDNNSRDSMNLRIQIGEDEQIYPINGMLRTTLNQVEIRAEAGPPALYISTADGQEKIALQGQSTESASVGLVFTEPGNEGIVLISPSNREQAAILRIVRGPEADAPNYLMEVLSPNDESNSQSQTSQSRRMQPNEEERIELTASNIRLQIDSVSGLKVNARYLPMTWLFVPAVLLVLAGALGYWRQPAFLFTQLFERATSQTVTIYQADSQSELDAILTAQNASTQES